MATIRKRGTRYQVQVRRHGQTPISKTFVQLEDARQWARAMEVKADRRELPDDPKALDKMTLRQLVERYRDAVVPRKRGAEIETIILNAFLRDHPRLCGKALSALTLKDFASYRDERLQTIQPSTLSRELSPVRHMFSVACSEWGLPVRNPLTGLSIPEAARRERRLRQGEFEKLMKAAARCRSPLIGRIIALALESGMRRGEILAIRHQHINWSERSLLIPYTKNGQARTIPLTPRAIALLSPYIGDKVFPMTANALRLAWQRLRDRAGSEDLHFHDLRHEAISRFFEMGLTTPEVAAISGHRDVRMLMRYSHPTRMRILEVFDRSSGSPSSI